MSSSPRQLKAMLRKNWLMKIRHPFITCAEILLPTIVMLLLITVRTKVDTRIHPAQAYIRKGMFVDVGASDISPSFEKILETLYSEGEYLAFSPDNKNTRLMLKIMSVQFPLLKVVSKVFKDEAELEDYIRSDFYGISDEKNSSNARIKGAIIFHEQGPELFDYSIRLNHSWAFSGFPDVKTIMDTNGPFLNDLELGVTNVPMLQYGLSGFLTLQKVMDSFIIFSAQSNWRILSAMDRELKSDEATKPESSFTFVWTHLIPSKIRIAPFPTRAYTDDEFQSIIKTVMGVLYLLGFLYPVSRLINCLVYEKEQKIREGLHMMGLKESIFHLSWFITYTLQFALSSGLITLLTMDSLFKYSDKTLVFVYFFLFGLSGIMLSFLISTFFSRAKTAVAVGTLSFLGAFFPYYTINDPAVPMIFKVLASLLSPTAFALGTVNFADYERAHVGVRWTNMWQASSGVNFLVCLLMLILDTLLYCIIGLYFDKVLPRENGVKYPWNFWFTQFFKKENYLNAHHMRTLETSGCNEPYTNSDCEYGTLIEPMSLDMKQQEVERRCLQIQNLCKVYNTDKGKCCVVNSLQLTLYENQILALLGHNGAGKSTTISMLVGLLPPTSGDVLVFGKSIRSDLEEIRKILGICPQHDILFPKLTVKEHLEIFADLKGVNEEAMESTVMEMVGEIGLVDKVNTLVSALSGGMRRKLSLGLALIGNSKVIILDEPTSGMDPYSMRSTWQLIKKFKKNRVILLTTHSMDEADVLGDRIAIMANGSLKCCGSSLFLKKCFGVGYTLTLVKTTSSSSAALDIVHRHVPNATRISDAGSEISFRLPLASTSSFESMFREIESCIRRLNNNLENDGEDKCASGIESYGISVTTLEEVFLRVAGCDVNENERIELSEAEFDIVSEVSGSLQHYPELKPIVSKEFTTFGFITGMIFSAIARAWIVAFAMFFHCINRCNIQQFSPAFFSTSIIWKHFKALFRKRAICARRDKRTIVFQLIIPGVFLSLGLLFLRLKPHPDQQSITLTTSHFNPSLRGGSGDGPIPFNLTFPISKMVASHVRGGWIQKLAPRTYKFPDSDKALQDAIDVSGPLLGPALISMSEFLITSLNESYQSRYGAVVMDPQHDDGSLGYTILHNCSCQHAAPTYINLMSSAILRLATDGGNMTIQTRNHPLPMTRTQLSQRHDLDAFSIAIIVSIAFSFIPSSFAVTIVKEREVKAKHQQIISGVSILSYWTSTYFWDFISFLLPTSTAMILFYVFDVYQFIGGDCLLPTIILFLEYGSAAASSTYCMTFLFSEHSIAQNVVLLVHFFTGLVLMIISFIMGLIQGTKSLNFHLKNIFRISPGFCFADGLASLALQHQGMKRGSKDGPLSWNVTGASICYLALESIIYFLLALAIEQLSFTNSFHSVVLMEWWQKHVSVNRSSSTGSTVPLLESFSHDDACHIDEDLDVRAERHRVLSGAANNSILYLHNLRKVYPGRRKQTAKIAVDSLCFSVQEGECFGFLGTNGAGKTTTLSMLSGEECPSSGTAYIFGNDIRLNPKAARHIVGYCPQFDALLDLLTVKEHLELYARIKGVPDDKIRDVINEKIMEFDLSKHADKPSSSLSGGNKRKLSVAIAMIGDPPIVILDEPSTGMDPIAKRFMWEVISRLSTRRGKTAVILTTHSMNEAQALCTRIGIMVGGRFRCIGSPQHLKTRFGNHLELELKPMEVNFTEVSKLCKKISEGVLHDLMTNSRSNLSDPEICVGGNELINSENESKITLSPDMILPVGRWLGDEKRVMKLLTSTPVVGRAFGEQLSDQLIRDGIPLKIFSEWWLATEAFSVIDSFVLSSFPGATFEGSNGLSIKYQLPYGEDSSLADIFGHLERNRGELGVAEYSINQSTLETIFNHFAAIP